MTYLDKVSKDLKRRFESKPVLKATDMYQGKKRKKPMTTGEWEKYKQSKGNN